MKAVVTGVSGFIGTYLAKRLIKEGHDVFGVDIVDPVIDVNFAKSDLSVSVPKEVSDADVVFHLAALTDVDEARRNPDKAYAWNVKATLNVVKAIKGRGIKFVFASSAAVYGDPLYLPVDEDHPLKPKGVYGSTKVCSEMLVNTMLKDEKPTILRYFNVYGPHPRLETNNVVTKFIVMALREGRVTVYGDGEQTRDFVFVEDVVEATLRSIGVEGTYNVGSGRAVSINELVRLIEKVLGKKVEVVYLPPRPDDIRHSVASIERIRRSTGWEPKTPLEEGLRVTAEAYSRSFIS